MMAEREPKPVTTQVAVHDWMHITRDALGAHRTQVPPTATWFRIDAETMRTLYPWEDYHLAESRLAPLPEGSSPFEDDLFAGLR
jgi:mycothiol S-conjugate amidase